MSGLKQTRMAFDDWRMRMQGERARLASTFHNDDGQERVSVSVKEAVTWFAKRHAAAAPLTESLYKHLCDRSQFGEEQKWQFDKAIWEHERAELTQ